MLFRSVHAPLGLRAARLYGEVAPAASHAQHMPSHIFFALGMWDDAIAANIASLDTARAQGDGGYHSLVWLAYAYLQQERKDAAAPLLASVARDVGGPRDREARLRLALLRAMWLAETGGDGRRVDRAAVAPGCPRAGQHLDHRCAHLQRQVRDRSLGLTQPGQRLSHSHHKRVDTGRPRPPRCSVLAGGCWQQRLHAAGSHSLQKAL